MNQKQREYALGRVNEILKNTKQALEDKHYVKATYIEHAEAKRLLEEAGFKWIYSSHPRNYVDFSSYENPAYFTEGYIEALDKVTSAAQSTKDAIMLGDSEEALSAINAFEATCKE